jgi:NAD(P)-dependent dehydrogenase (short-subunit alcohol dehydrogenase family)
MNLAGKTAIVTGSSRGIGKAVAKRLARDGAKVAVNCVSTVDKARAVVEEIREAGGEAVVVQADVAKKADAERLIADTIAAFGQVDILVSNAGIVIDRPFVDSSDEDWRRAIEGNLHGFFNVARAVLPHMARSNSVLKTGRVPPVTLSCSPDHSIAATGSDPREARSRASGETALTVMP